MADRPDDAPAGHPPPNVASRQSSMFEFGKSQWAAALIFITGLVALPSSGPTFSANDHQLTVPRGVFGLMLITLGAARLVYRWRHDKGQ